MQFWGLNILQNQHVFGLQKRTLTMVFHLRKYVLQIKFSTEKCANHSFYLRSWISIFVFLIKNFNLFWILRP